MNKNAQSRGKNTKCMVLLDYFRSRVDIMFMIRQRKLELNWLKIFEPKKNLNHDKTNLITEVCKILVF